MEVLQGGGCPNLSGAALPVARLDISSEALVLSRALAAKDGELNLIKLDGFIGFDKGL